MIDLAYAHVYWLGHGDRGRLNPWGVLLPGTDGGWRAESVELAVAQAFDAGYAVASTDGRVLEAVKRFLEGRFTLATVRDGYRIQQRGERT